MPLFTIVIPAFNAEKTIRKCLNSVFDQRFIDYEIVVINDGSTDKTLKILKEYKNSKLHVYTFKNAGISVTRQRGIELSKGKYIVWLDADDSITPELLETLHSAIIEHNSPDIIRYQANLVNDHDCEDHNRYNFFDYSNNNVLSGVEALRKWSNIPSKEYTMYWLFAFKRTIFSSITSFPNLRCHEDMAVIPLLVASAKSVVTLDYCGYNYTCNNPGSITTTPSKEAERSRAKDFMKAYHYAIQNFALLPNISPLDQKLFVSDFDKHRLKKYNLLPKDLKEEFADLFGIQ